MRKTSRFEAYLDDYNLISIYLSTSFYNGESKTFFIRDAHGKLSPLSISQQTTSHDYMKYILLINDESITIGDYYEILEEHGLRTRLQYGLIVRTNRFNDSFYSDRDDFGSQIINGNTRFVLWAPTANNVQLQLFQKDDTKIVPLVKEEKGCWVYELEGNHHGLQYLYLVHVNGSINETVDPYAYGTTANSARSVVIDFDQYDVKMNDEYLPPFKKTEAVITELSVRDFSMDKSTNIENKGKYLGLIEKGRVGTLNNKVGFDYLLEMGYTHVQLMPVYDFATIDELNPKTFYNWGYDPAQYNSLEGSYSLDPSDPHSRIQEFLTVVSTYHRHGLRVIMDVVYNHMYDMAMSSFEKIVPYYYFRLSDQGAISNGSFCGNDVDSSNAMVRKFIVDSVIHFTKHYHMDGFRFDLMGILDTDTMNTIVSEIEKIRPDSLIYGEGWNMPTMLPESSRATMFNMHKMPNVGFFNDFYRDHVKGPTSVDLKWAQGYCLGDTNYIDAMKASLLANTRNHFSVKLFDEPDQSINYVECHDNMTLWDKIKEACKEDSKEERIRKQKLVNGVLAVSQGILFYHFGQEAARSKMGVENSYRSNDEINKVDYARTVQYQEIVNYTKDMIKLRKEYPIFRFESSAEIQKHIKFTHLDHNALLYEFQDVEKYVPHENVKVFINPTKHHLQYPLDSQYKLIANEAGLLNFEYTNKVYLNPLSMVIVGKVKEVESSYIQEFNKL